mgnify:CR=1 FL=1
MRLTNTFSDLTIIILAGGKSTRMGRDKGFLNVGVDSFVKRILNVSQQLTSNIFISVNKTNQSNYQSLGVPLVVDEEPENGPIGGIVSSIKRLKTNWFLVLAVDSPLVTAISLNNLWMSKEGYEGVLYRSGHTIHPLVALYHKQTIPRWKNALSQGKLKITTLVETFHLLRIEVSGSNENAIQNINTPEEYSEVIKHVSNGN